MMTTIAELWSFDLSLFFPSRLILTPFGKKRVVAISGHNPLTTVLVAPHFSGPCKGVLNIVQQWLQSNRTQRTVPNVIRSQCKPRKCLVSLPKFCPGVSAQNKVLARTQPFEENCHLVFPCRILV